MEYPDMYAEYLQRNPEFAQRIARINETAQNAYERNPYTRDILETALTPEQFQRVSPLLEERIPTLESFREVKGRANTPVADQYQEALGAALRDFSEKGVLPGRLAESEAAYSRRVPVTDFATGNIDYKPIEDVRSETISLLEELKSIPWEQRPRNIVNRTALETSDLGELVRGWDTDTLANIYKKLIQSVNDVHPRL
jgi:hypothetical protein